MKMELEKDLLEEINEEEIEDSIVGAAGSIFQGLGCNENTTGISLCIMCNFGITHK